MRPESRTIELRANLCRIHVDAVAFSVMVGTGETYLAAFVLALGMGELAAGLIASVPMLAGALLQLVSPAAIRMLGSHRRWVVLCAVAQASSFIPLVLAALCGSIDVYVVFAIAALYWGTGMATGPAWNTWVSTLIPPSIRANYFAKRSRAAQIAVLAALLFGGISLQYGDSHHKPLLAFAVLFTIAGVCRFISAGLLAGQTEPQPPDQSHREVPLRELALRFRHGQDGRLLIYMPATQAAVQISGPYFTPFMLEQLRFSYAQYLLLIATSYSARVLVLPALGVLVRRIGARRVMWFSGLGILPLSAMWLVSDSLLYLFFVQLIAGAVWAAYELTTFLLLFETIAEEERTSVLTTFNLAHAVATVCGSAVGGFMLTRLGTDHAAYLTIFAFSAGVRLLTLALLVRAVKSIPAPTIPKPVQMPIRIEAVRPQMGVIEQPILSGMPGPPSTQAPLTAPSRPASEQSMPIVAENKTISQGEGVRERSAWEITQSRAEPVAASPATLSSSD
jgi:MFS family permease